MNENKEKIKNVERKKGCQESYVSDRESASSAKNICDSIFCTLHPMRIFAAGNEWFVLPLGVFPNKSMHTEFRSVFQTDLCQSNEKIQVENKDFVIS